jgi:NTE family protein
MRKKISYGLALSGGGARGIAHLGMLQAMEENNIHPDVISGTSMGALVAVGYGLGMQPVEMLNMINREIKPLTLSNMNMRRMGLFNLKKVEKLYRQWAPTDDFSALKIPTFITVTNLNTGHFEIKSEGPLVAFTIASASIPLLFCPVIINGTYYVDGGLTKNMAAHVLQDKCDKIIGSHVNHIAEINSFKRMKDVAARSYHLAVFNTIRDELGYCDYVVDPPNTRLYSTLDFNKADEIFEVGYREGLLLVKQLQADEEAQKHPLLTRLKLWRDYRPSFLK